MPDPPPKPKKGPEDLHEVERALSVLQGRHPEHERARREDEESRRRRAAQLDTVARSEPGELVRGGPPSSSPRSPIIALFSFIAVFGRRGDGAPRAHRCGLGDVPRPWLHRHRDLAPRLDRRARRATVEPGCLLAVSTDTKPLSITRAGVTIDTAPPALFCTCTSERIARRVAGRRRGRHRLAPRRRRAPRRIARVRVRRRQARLDAHRRRAVQRGLARRVDRREALSASARR